MTETAYVFPDANVLLHFQPPDRIDWPSPCGADRVLLVAQSLLLKELAKAKDLHPCRHLSGVPLEPDMEELAFPHCPGPPPGQPHVDRANGVAEFEWPRIQHDAAVSSLDPWLPLVT